MGNFIDRFGRAAVANPQPDTGDRLARDGEPTDFADPSASEAEDAYWRELDLRQLAEGGGVDYDEADASSWTYRALERERLEADFGRIIGRLR
jgi:hypothetical protein